MQFRTLYSDRERVISVPGDAVKIEYSPVFDEDGVWHLEESGKSDWYSYIQSHKDSCDINLILQRYANGDIDALNKRQGLFMDVTEFPKTYAEMLNIVINGEKEFESLPIDVKAKFNHSFSEFVAGIGSKEWAEKLGIVYEKSDIGDVSENLDNGGKDVNVNE